MVELFIVIIMLLSGCTANSESAINPNEVNCEKKYTYEAVDGYNYSEPHKTSEVSADIDENIVFRYTYTYEEEIEKVILIMKNGDVYTSNTDVYSYSKNTDWESITPVKTIDNDTLIKYLKLLEDVVVCKPVNVLDVSYTESIKADINIHGFRNNLLIELGSEYNLIKRSTDENAIEIIKWIEELCEELFKEDLRKHI